MIINKNWIFLIILILISILWIFAQENFDPIENFHEHLFLGNIEKVKFYLREFPNIIKYKNKDGFCPVTSSIYFAFSHEEAHELLNLLYEAKADFNCLSKMNSQTPFDMTPLAYCIYQEPYLDNFIDDLIKFGADPNHPTVRDVINFNKNIIGKYTSIEL